MLGASASARADLSPALLRPVAPDEHRLDQAGTSGEAVISSASAGESTGGLNAGAFPVAPLSQTPLAEPSRENEPLIRDLPPAPGSAGLFLSAVLSMGAWQLVRSARDLNLGALPEWYHSGGPGRVGHAVPIDLNWTVLPVSCFEQPPAAEPSTYHPAQCEIPSRLRAQSCLAVTGPRAPPAVSL